ncbi:polyprenyl synthetase family protein [Demequina pelophila]|uniref:polyprenyl synthetase family protein n=1 Tax=Demequina pelophila TaxID=1638984 RepID=UPI000784D7CE|nr:polyprenyl synthetase family protein [Demequina pelophila]
MTARRDDAPETRPDDAPETRPDDSPATTLDGRLTAALDRAHRAMGPAGAAADDLHRHLAASSAGGKAFRARLLLATFDACVAADPGPEPEADRSRALDLAAALELFQTSALIHDDVLDGSDTRRGRPAAHRAFEAEHRHGGFTGDAKDYGRAGAILAGDAGLIAALATAGADRVGPRAAALFVEMALVVTAGQHLDMRVAVEPWGDADQLEAGIMRVMLSKTASYTAEMPLAMGAAAAGADGATIDALRAAGRPLGVAFQLRDDLLGVLGSPEETGKPVGDDLREGKRTLAVHHVVAHGTESERAALLAVLGRHDASDDQIAAAVQALRDAGAVDAVEARIEALAGEAREALVAALAHPEGVLAMVDAATRRRT